MKKYDKYKDSGIKWIGEVPKHWNVRRLKDVLKDKVTDGPHETPSFIDEGIPFLSVDSIQDGELIFENCRYISVEDFEKYKVKCDPKTDDILMGKAASVGKIARVKVKFEFSVWSPLALLRPDLNKVTPIFLEYSLKSSYMQYNIVLLSNINTQSNIGMKDIPRLKYSLPPFEEQIIISDYLDEVTQKINKVIENKKNQIDLLKNFELIIFNEVFTKGINVQIETFDSNTDWIGNIPKDWTLKRLKKLLMPKAGIKIGPFGSQLKIEIFKASGYKVYGQENVIYNDFKLGENYIDEAKFNELKQCQIVPDDIVIAMMGTIGNTQLVPKGIEEGIMNSHLLRLRTDINFISARYLSLLLNKAYYIRYNIIRDSKGAIMQGLNSQIIKALLVALPPIDEQEKIINHLDEKTFKIQKSINVIQEELSTLEEYKKILINDVVTGKMKVTA